MRASTLRHWAGLPAIALTALVACSSPLMRPLVKPAPAPPTRAELLGEFRSGHVHLDCTSCRFEFRDAEWMLRSGHHEDLVVSILLSRDGSGRSWYLLGRAAEIVGERQLALTYYSRSLTTRRNPIVALWPLSEDVNYRIRQLEGPSAPATAAAPSAPPAAGTAVRRIEFATQNSVAVQTRPGQLGAYLVSLDRGARIEVLDRSGDWKEVRLADGRTGWVWGHYVSTHLHPLPPKHPTEEADAQAPAAEPAKAAPAKKADAPKAVASAKPPAAKRASPAATRAAARAKAAADAAKKASPAAAKPAVDAKPAEAKPAVEAKPAEAVAAAKPAVDAKPAEAVVAAKPVGPAPATPVAQEKPAEEAAAATPAPVAKAEAEGASSDLPARVALTPAGLLGILGSPLPAGARLARQSHGVGGAEDHPTQTYAVPAAASEIVGFFEREMERAGWRKSFASSDYLLYFVKEDRTLGVLVDRDGGTFTLMGS